MRITRLHDRTRSGLFLVLVVALAGVAGCTSASPRPEVGSPSDDLQGDPRSCPVGLFDALTEHLEARPVGDFADVTVFEEPTYPFLPDTLDATVREGCVFRVESASPAGNIMVQIFGVTSGSDESQVLGILESAGWVQPFPDVEPHAYESEDRDPAGNAELFSVGVSPVGGPDVMLGFDGWGNYFDTTEMILQSVPRI